jgi:hypothetical protein
MVFSTRFAPMAVHATKAKDEVLNTRDTTPAKTGTVTLSNTSQERAPCANVVGRYIYTNTHSISR